MKPKSLKNEQAPITVLVVDDHPLARLGIIKALQSTTDINVVGQANDGREAIELAKKLKPHVVTLDLAMPKTDGIETARYLKHALPAIKIIIVSGFATGFFPQYLKQMRVHGYVSKEDAYAEIVAAVRAVNEKQVYFSTSVAQEIAKNELTQQELSRLKRLTKTELSIALQLVQGKNNAEIGEKLHIEPSTVSSHRTRLLKKLELASEVELLHLAIRDKFLLDPNV